MDQLGNEEVWNKEITMLLDEEEYAQEKYLGGEE